MLEGVDLSIPGERERVVAEMKAIEESNRAAAIARAKELGMPLRVERPDGGVSEIAGIDENGQLLYRTTHNVSAAISTGANLLQAAPYNLTGTNILVGVWDGGGARPTHQEFGSRVTLRDGAANDNHATHVAGTIIASGVVASAKGMATAARVDSYEWTSDLSELTAAGAAAANQTNKVLVSNHSYGYLSGWDRVNGGSPYRLWTYYGDSSGTNGYEYDFGRYNTTARETDAVIVSAPFLTTFWSASNDRDDNPANGASITLGSTSTNVVTYSNALHPPGDGIYRGGYENIGYNGVAKNIVTVGAVNDATNNGVRATNRATMSDFSSWGPTDDGRIKPDLVANGVDLYSSLAGSDSSYGTYSGTSMSSPNAAGSAALVVQEYIRLFGGAPRASTVKGLLIHTADDLGTAGPDYQNGWGLMNAKAAVDLVRDDAAIPAKARLTEGLITTSSNSITQAFKWDGASPIRATLCWTDPAGTATTSNDLRTARLINNLDLRVVSPNGVTNRPYVMPFVGTWTTNAMSQAATTGTNNTDNVEQVYIAAPSVAGTYQAVVTYQGTLSNNQQHYALLISGSGVSTPTISDIPDQSVALGSVAGAVAFTVGHPEVAASSLTLSATSSNSTLVPAANVTFGGSAENRTVTVTPAAGVTGTSTITVTVSDGTMTTSDSFILTVNAVPDIAIEAYRGSDSSSASVYNDNVFVGRNGGDGFGAWSGSKLGMGGNYIGVTSVRSRSFAVYAGSGIMGDSAEATRSLGTPLAVGESLAVQLGYTGVATWGEIGMNFFSGQSLRLSLRFIGGLSQWLLNAGGSDFGTGIAWAGGTPLQVVFRRNDGNGYSIMLVSGSRSYSASGLTSALGPMSIDSVQFYSSAQGANEHLGFDGLTRGLDVANVSPLDLGSVQVGSSGTARTIVVRNDGGATLSSISSGKSGTNPNDFVMSGSLPATLAAGAGASFTLALSPTAVGDRSAAFSVTSNDPDEGTVNFNLNGTATQGTATVVLGNLSQTYDGTGRAVSVSTTPPGLSIGVTYEGSPSAPTNAGTYAVVATVNDANYTGTASGTLTVAKASANVALGNLNQTYDGTPRPVSVTTTPPGLSTSVTYNGSVSVPINGGTYSVVATVNDANYAGSATDTLTVTQVTPTISDIPDQTVALGNVAGPVAFTVGHPEVAASSLSVSATSSNPTLVPAANVSLGGSGEDRTVSVTPATGVTGTSTITVTVSDGTATISDSFVLTVNAVPDIAVEAYRGSDSSSASVYNDNVFVGRNGGDGFGAWTASASGAGGNYLGVTSVRSRSFAVYAGTGTAGNSAEATRAFGVPLAVGESFGVQLGYTKIANGGEIGLNFFSGGSFRLGLKFIGGTEQWVLNAGGSNFGTGIGWAEGTPLQVVFRRNAGNGYSIMLISGARSYSASGLTSALGPMSIDSVQFYSSAQGANEHLGFDGLTRGLDVANVSPLDLGSVQVGSSGTARTIVVRNDGGATLSSISSGKSGTNPNDFVMSGTIPASLPAGASGSFTLAMYPAAVGARSATFSITSNDPDENTVNFSLSGIATRGTAAVVLGDLSQTYNGTARMVSVSTTPPGLSVGVTYNGLPDAPVNAGTYTVVATVDDTDYQGSVTNVLTVAKAAAGIVVDGLNQTYNGTGREVVVATTPPGLAATVTYNGSVSAPTDAGTYSVVAKVDEANYEGSATNTLTVSQATPVINQVPAAEAITYGQSLGASILTGGSASVSGSFAFTAPAAVPAAGTGSQSVTFTPSDSTNYEPVTTNVEVVVNKAAATVQLGDLSQAYNGTARAVAVMTTPPGLATSVTYNGASSAPTNVGTYAVVATVTDPNYEGSASGTLEITPSGVTFASLFGDTDPASDSDQDGLPALVEYALGGATNSNDVGLLPSILPGSRVSLVATVRTNNLDNLSVNAQFSSALASGWSATLLPGVRAGDQSNVPANFERRVFFFDAGTNAHTFMRLRFELQPASP